MTEPSPRRPDQPDGSPRMRPTSPATLLVAALAGAAVAWLAIANFYGQIPRLPWVPPVTLLLLGVAQMLLARGTRARIERRPGAPRVDPLAVARFVVLAKASALAGAIFTGGYAGIALGLLVDKRGLAAAGDDTPAALVGLAGAIALVVGGLLLERACQVPPGGEPDRTGEDQAA